MAPSYGPPVDYGIDGGKAYHNEYNEPNSEEDNLNKCRPIQLSLDSQVTCQSRQSVFNRINGLSNQSTNKRQALGTSEHQKSSRNLNFLFLFYYLKALYKIDSSNAFA